MKKLLALVLALVMSMSLVTISNAAYSDKADIDLKEAVDVLSAVGVFEGSDGKFDPKADLTREQAAKLVAYLQLGQKSADALVGGNKFTDVAANRWSAGYVDYCATTGVVAGVGNGQFNPTGSLTALQFGKMLLVCLGYDATTENLTGSDWQINTSKLMTSAKLLKGLDSVKANDVITREQAAQMMLNAIKAPTVEYDTKGSTISVNGAVIDLGGSKATYVTATVAEDSTVKNIGKTQLTNSNEYTVELGEKLFTDLKLVPGATDAFERPATVWTLKAKTIGTYADTPDLSYTAATKISTIYADLGLTKGISKTAVTYFVDGKPVDYAATVNKDIVKGETKKLGGDGALLDVYYDDDAHTLYVVIVNTYIGEVAAVYAETTTKDAYVTVKNMDNATGGYGHPGAFETEGFSKEDVVAYTYSDKAGEKCIESMYLAEKVTGKMSTVTNTNSVVVGDTTYKANAASSAMIAEFASTIDKGSDVTVYLDANGYALYVDGTTTLEYAVVLDLMKSVGGWNNKVEAKLLFTDGTTKTVTVVAYDGAGTAAGDVEIENGVEINYTSGNDIASAQTVAELDQYDIVSYVIDADGDYELTLAGNNYKTAPAAAIVENGKNRLALNAGNKVNTNDTDTCTKADAKTIFLTANVVAGKKPTYSVYEGFANVPTIKANAGAQTITAGVKKTGATAAAVVFILNDANVSVSSQNKDVLYVKGNSTHTNTGSYVGRSYTTELGYYWQYNAFLNGDSIVVKSDAPINADTLYDGPIYNAKGLLTSADHTRILNSTNASDAYTGTGKGTDAMKNDVIKLAGDSWAYTSDVKVYFIDVNGDMATRSIDEIAYDEDDLVLFKLNDKGLITTVFIKVVDEAEVIGPVAPTSNILSDVTLAYAPGTFTVTFDIENYTAMTSLTVELYTVNGSKLGGDMAAEIGSSGDFDDVTRTISYTAVNGAGLYDVVITVDGVASTFRCEVV